MLRVQHLCWSIRWRSDLESVLSAAVGQQEASEGSRDEVALTALQPQGRLHAVVQRELPARLPALRRRLQHKLHNDTNNYKYTRPLAKG